MLKMFPGRLLEEIDGADYARIERALEARHYADAWERHHTPHSERALAAHRKQEEARQRVEDAKLVAELAKLAATWKG